MTVETRKGSSRSAAGSGAKSGLSPLAALVRRHDPDRYRTALFAPVERREGLFALYAFNYEIARVREIVSQPILGQIRLQWWREAISAAFSAAAPRAHIVALPLSAAIRDFSLTRSHFDRLIDARERDLASTVPADAAALEAYAEESSATLVYLALEVLGVREPAAVAVAREVGIAYALAGLLRALPFHARAGRRYIPRDVAVAAGLDPHENAELRPDAALRGAVRTLADVTAGHLRAARRHRAAMPKAALPALLPAIVADRALDRLRRADWNPFDPRVAAPDPLLTWRLAAAMLRCRF